MYNITFLTKDEIENLEIFKKYGTAAAVSDFSIGRGAYVSSYCTSEGTSLKDRTGWYWTKTPDGTGDARAVAYMVI